MERAADWQLENPSKHDATDWSQGAGCAGITALTGISPDDRYRNALVAMGTSTQWLPGTKLYDADDYCIGQTYAELSFLFRDLGMIGPLRAHFDEILAKPSAVQSLDFSGSLGNPRENWSWCDSLFMGPPTWVRLYAATGNRRYLDFAVQTWWRTTAVRVTGQHLDQVEYDYSLRFFFRNQIALRYPDIGAQTKLFLFGRSATGSAFNIQLSLITQDGAAYGGLVTLQPNFSACAVALHSLHKVRSPNRPHGYPVFIKFWSDETDDVPLDLKQIEGVLFSIGPGLPGAELVHVHSLEIDRIWME